MKTALHISLMSLVGTAHLMLVVGGCIFYRDLLTASFPMARNLGVIAGIIGFVSLFGQCMHSWPYRE